MELIHGFPLLYQQFTALFKKNLLLSWRNKSATFLQLFSSFFFMFLLFGIEKASDSRSKATTGYKTVTNPQPMWESPIPPCEEKFYVKMPCFDFVWSGNDSSRIGNIVTAIMNNNPNRQIPPGKVSSSSSLQKPNLSLSLSLSLSYFLIATINKYYGNLNWVSGKMKEEDVVIYGNFFCYNCFYSSGIGFKMVRFSVL